jgi:hypothetical protein
MEIEAEIGDLTPEKIGTENPSNPEEEETPEGPEKAPKASVEEQETSLKPGKSSLEIEEANKKLYARMKKAEEEAKELREKLGKSTKQDSPIDSLSLAKTVSVLKDFNADELNDIDLIARAKNIPLDEAARTEEAKILVAARREKVAKEQKAPLPSSSLPGGKTTKDIRTMSSEEHKALEESYRKKTRRQME